MARGQSSEACSGRKGHTRSVPACSALAPPLTPAPPHQPFGAPRPFQVQPLFQPPTSFLPNADLLPCGSTISQRARRLSALRGTHFQHRIFPTAGAWELTCAIVEGTGFLPEACQFSEHNGNQKWSENRVEIPATECACFYHTESQIPHPSSPTLTHHGGTKAVSAI